VLIIRLISVGVKNVMNKFVEDDDDYKKRSKNILREILFSFYIHFLISGKLKIETNKIKMVL
jgi:hypothetical protein